MSDGFVLDTSKLDEMIATNPGKLAAVVTKNAYREHLTVLIM